MTTIKGSQDTLLSHVDTADFRSLFVEELGWDNPDQPARTISVDDDDYKIEQVAGYKGLRIWHCPQLPGRRVQRAIDNAIAKDNLERLVIFSDSTLQQWRWPRRAQTGGVNAKLLVHQHVVGEKDTRLLDQLAAIAIDFDDSPTLVELLARMRSVFDVEAETASVAAARLMGKLYTDLESSVTGHEATLLLARLLFLLFGDDSGMWRSNMFRDFLAQHTSSATLHTDLTELFRVLDSPEGTRDLPAESPYAQFRYINGGLYHGGLHLPPLHPDFRSDLLEACEFDWSLISPAVFGSMFQVVKDKDARRHGGEHYTTEENILKTIGPLLLDELHDRLEAAWDDKGQLTRLHNELGRLHVLDPACGCGNFLIVAYRELRALELEILKRRRDLDDADGKTAGQGRYLSQMTLDVTGDIKVTLDHFHGLEIEEWPARIAETAMLLVDHLANLAMEDEFGRAPDRLPIAITADIRNINALRQNWAEVVPPGPSTIILGNPPFNGARLMSKEQKADMTLIWGSKANANFDYVTAWYKKTIDFYGPNDGRWAFVSTNSICQGEPVADLWEPILGAGWRCRFAHRSFQWDSEAPGKAAVHCSIVGFDRARTPRPVLWSYPEGGKGHGTPSEVTRINPYLVEGPIVLVRARRGGPINPALPKVTFGSMANDKGHLIVEPAEYPSVMADPVAAKYIRPFQQVDELLYDTERWCIWIEEGQTSDIAKSPVLSARVDAVEAERLKSDREATRKLAKVPWRFGEVRHTGEAHLAIPRHVGESRPYFSAKYTDGHTITGDANFMVPDPDGFALGIVSSSMFIAWMRAIGGRIKSDLRFSGTYTYNSFPLPHLTAEQRERICDAAQGLIEARAGHPGLTLASMYKPGATPPDILGAHRRLDLAVDKVFNTKAPLDTVEDRQKVLFRAYAKLTDQEDLLLEGETLPIQI